MLENKLLKVVKIEKAIVNLGNIVKIVLDENKESTMVLIEKKIEALPSGIDAN